MVLFMKRILSIIFVLSLLVSVAAGCASEEIPVAVPETPAAPQVTEAEAPVKEVVPESPQGRRLNIVSTIFPQYDWVREILGVRADEMDLTLLISSALDMHNFQPSVSDIAAIANADIFIYISGHSSDWADAALRQSTNPNMVVLDLLEVLVEGVKHEQIIEGMQHDDCDDDDHGDDGHTCSSHGHSHDHDDDRSDDDCDDPEHDHDDAHHHGGVDEHVWLSLRNAAVFCYAIADVLVMLDPDYADVYMGNLERYVDRLLALDEEYLAQLSGVSNRTLLFADRFPFRYLVDDYGLHYFAAFSGCSAETEASFSTIIFLAGKVDDFGLNTIMITDSGNRAIAEAVISATESGGQQILELDSMHSVTMTDIESGVTFLSIMENNLQVLMQALS